MPLPNLMNMLNQSKSRKEKALKAIKYIFLNLFSQYFIRKYLKNTSQYFPTVLSIKLCATAFLMKRDLSYRFEVTNSIDVFLSHNWGPDVSGSNNSHHVSIATNSNKLVIKPGLMNKK